MDAGYNFCCYDCRVSDHMTSRTGLAADGNGNLYIAYVDNHRVRKVDPHGTITTVAGTGVRAIPVTADR